MSPSNAPELLGTDARGRPVLLLHVARLADVPAHLGLPRPKFILLVAMDAEAVSHDARWTFAGAAIDDGCVYMCAWGPGCSWVEDDLDLDRDATDPGATGPDPAPHVMTTWHDGVPIEEAVGFWLECADPRPFDDPDALPVAEQCLLAVTVGERAWAEAVRRDVARRLTAPPPVTEDDPR